MPLAELIEAEKYSVGAALVAHEYWGAVRPNSDTIPRAATMTCPRQLCESGQNFVHILDALKVAERALLRIAMNYRLALGAQG
jgi:hypothetical protein